MDIDRISPLTQAESHAADQVAVLLNQSNRIVRWRDDAPGGRALVVHTPWARVVIARTPAGARRWHDGYLQGRWPAQCLMDSLEFMFPQVLTPWGTPEEFEALPFSDEQRKFVGWAFRTGWRRPWPLGFTPRRVLLGAVGSWSTRVPYALVLQQAPGASETLWQLREVAPQPEVPSPNQGPQQHGPPGLS